MFDQTNIKIGTSLYYIESFPERMPPEKPSVVQELIVTKVGKKYIYFGEKRRLCKGEGSIEAPWSASKWQSWKWLSHCYSCKLEAQLNCNRSNLVREIDTTLRSKGSRLIDEKLVARLSFGTLEIILNDLITGVGDAG